MSLETPTWDKIIGSLGSTTSEFGGNWANLISDYFNGVNLALVDASKIPIIGTLTRYKFEKLGLFDTDQSHSITVSVDDIDTGANRKIRIRRMNTPNEEDFMVLENMPQTLVGKTISVANNTITNIANAHIASGAGIVYSKLNLTNSIVAGDLTSDSVITVKILDSNVTLAKLASNSVNSSKIVDDSIVNADINSAAAIVYSKLSLGNSVVNADINTSAAIAWTKISKSGSVLSDLGDLSITTPAQYNIIMRNGSSQWINFVKGSNSTALTVDASGVLAYTTITNAMLAGSIAYSKLTLTTSIVNGDIAAAAAIAYSKLNLATSILNADINAAASIAYSKLNLATSIVNADISASAAIVYSKLSLTGGIVNADVNASAAIAYTKLALTGTILNADINASAAIADSKLAQITNKAKLPSAILYNDVDNSFGAHYFDLTRMTAPSNPAANDARFYVKQVDSNNDGVFVKVKKSGGFVEVQVA
jgi:hypothetical protein